ncbi:LuxR C-terminal-related transcriptional regulator [Plantactinospora sp. B6F1]|uniref:helix-turn-helix transcriptional regulator n=1 Tax=Plantactinospora sp. B6F1 TaxID=3158971 RepID=UPI0032D90CB4
MGGRRPTAVQGCLGLSVGVGADRLGVSSDDPDLDVAWLADRVRALFRHTVPYDEICVGLTDPLTGLITAVQNRRPPVPPETYLETEYVAPDVNRVAWLGVQSDPVGVLSAATVGKLVSSNRYRWVLRPSGVRHELRAALVDQGLRWGFLTLLRGPELPDFSPVEAGLVRSALPELVRDLRTTLLRTSTRVVAERPSGVALIGVGGLVEEASPAAEGLFAQLASYQSEVGLALPVPVATMAASLRAPAARESRRALLRDPDGGWLVLTGRRLASAGAWSRVVVSFEPASPMDVAPLVLRTRGLTDRQLAVAMCVLRGMTNAEIADDLGISVHTVQDHLKANFAKVGVQSRRELVRMVFRSGYSERGDRGYSERVERGCPERLERRRSAEGWQRAAHRGGTEQRCR